MNVQKLRPKEPLSQVVFIHDYVQLVFQDEILSIYNRIALKTHDKLVHTGQTGFCDGLVSLMEQRVIEAGQSDEYALTIYFENGTQLLISSHGTGPEAFHFSMAEHLAVEQNTQHGAVAKSSAKPGYR